MDMEKMYFIVIDSQKQGPYSKEELIEMRISPSTLVWFEGLENWVEARQIEELHAVFQYNFPNPQGGYQLNTQEQRVGNVVYHADNMHITLFTPQGELYYRYAAFGDRLVAFILDRLICLLLSILPLVGPWLYYALLHSSSDQATVGQRAMNIKCISEEGNPIDFGQATGRFFMSLVSGFIFFIGYFLYFGSAKKQTLHDSVAKTLVVREIGRKNYGF